MGFMVPVIEKGIWYKAETAMGTIFAPADLLSREDLRREHGQRIEIEEIEGFGARLSAPGYLDCTDWTVFNTEEEAKAYLVETYDLCSRCGEDSEAEVCETCRTAEEEEGVV